jgi:DNA-binding NarL/FixJ family response regulator
LALQIVLADNQAIFRAGVARVIARETNFDIVAQCGNQDELRSAIQQFRDALVIFPNSFGPDVLHLLDRIAEADSRSLIIVEHGTRLDESLANRAAGVVLRSVQAQKLVECLTRIASGRRWVERSPDENEEKPDRVGQKVLNRLTPRELQIVALVTEGAKNRDIAHQLGTKEQVVKNYLRSIYDKTGVSDRLELALFTVHHKTLAEAADRVRQALPRLEQ